MPTYRSVKGSPLDATEFDGNTTEFDARLTALETNPPTPTGISLIDVAGINITFTLTDSTELGPFPMPVLRYDFRGEWLPATPYIELDGFAYDGLGTFIVMVDHTSASTFDRDAVGSPVAAGSFEIARWYVITTVGTTDFTLLGASANTVGVRFKATDAGSGTGAASPSLYLQQSGASTSTNIDDLANIIITNPNDDDFLLLTGTSPAAWTNRSPATVAALLSALIALDDLSDVDAAAPTDGQVLTWATSPGAWIPTTPAAAAFALDDLTDVDAAAPTDGQVLAWAASPGAWLPITPGASSFALDDLTDVSVPSPGDGDFLQYVASPPGWTNMAGSTTSALPDVTLPLDVDDLLLISQTDGASPATYTSTRVTVFDLLTSGIGGLQSATGASTGTLLNCPVAGNPATYLKVTISGTTRYIPAF